MKLLGRIFSMLFTLLTAVIVFAIYLLQSSHGLDKIYRIAAFLVPGELTIDHLEGQLRGPMSLRGVHYHNDHMDLQLAQLDLQWQPGALVDGRLQIDGLVMVGLHIVNESSTNPTNSLPYIRLPIDVQIGHATLHDFSLANRGTNTPFTLTDTILNNAIFRRHQLQIQQIILSAPHYHLTATGDLTPQHTYPLALTIDWTADGGEYGKLAGKGELSGDFQHLKIHHQLITPVRAVLDGVITDALTNLRWQCDLSAPVIKLKTLRAQWPALTLGVKLRGKGTLQRIQMEGELNSNYQSYSADHRIALTYEKGTLQLSRFDTTWGNDNTLLNLHGTFTNLAQLPRADLEGTWQRLRWPLQGDAIYHSTTGHFSLTGTLDHYHLQVNGNLAGHQIPSSTWSLSVDGTQKDLVINRIGGKLLEGTLVANGKLSLLPQLSWDASLQGSNLNPGVQWRDWPGQIAFTAHSSGVFEHGSTRALVEISSVQGKLKNLPIEGDGTLSINGNRFDLSKLRIASGGNQIIASGRLQDTWTAQWQIIATDLSHIVPGSEGHLQGSGTISGPRDSPLLAASLVGQQLKFGDKHIGEFNLALTVDSQGRLPSIVQIEAHDAKLGALHMEDFYLRGDGNAQHHQLQLFATATSSKVAIKINGSYQQRRWDGTIASLNIEAPIVGHWQLLKPARANFDQSTALVDEVCLKQESARFCAKAQWAAQTGWQTQVLLRRMPLNLVEDWLPNGVALVGNLDADVQANNTAGPIIGKLDAYLRAGATHQAIPGKGVTDSSTLYHQAHLTISLDDQILAGHLQAEFADGGAMQGNLTIKRHALPAPLGMGQSDLDTALVGQVHGDIKELSLLPALIPGVEHTQGHLFTTLTIAGSLDKPRLNGELHLENGGAAIPALGINPKAITLVAHSDDKGQLRVDLQLRSKDGSLRIGGDLRFDKASGLNIQAQLTGDQIEIINTPEFHVLASPNIHFSLQGHRIDLDGELVIPEANLRPRDVSGAVSASDDVVILGEEGSPTPKTAWLIYSQLRVRLGNFVKFSGFGLQGLLKGDFTLIDTPQRPTIARGELSISNGEYHAYGQNLDINRGRLLFIGGPVDNPGLGIRAVRVIQNATVTSTIATTGSSTTTNVTAGILVRGTMKAPQVQLFSDPVMADTDALSYLLTGRPISQATASQGQQLYGAALSLGLASGGLLASKIGQRFGIDELTVESGGSFGGGALVIRHYLSPQLYISYGVGLIEHFNVILVRYQISHQWSLQADSGATNGADIIYSLERK